MNNLSHPSAGAWRREGRPEAACVPPDPITPAKEYTSPCLRLPSRLILPVSLLATLLLIAGCTTVPADLGRSEVSALLAERGQENELPDGGETTAELLDSLTAVPLTPQSAVRITFLNNPQLSADIARLGFGAAEVHEAGRISNPVFSAAFLDSNFAGDKDQITYGLAVSFTDLLTLSSRKRLSEGAFAAMKQSLAAQVMRHAANTEASYYRYVAAVQLAKLRAQTAIAAGLSAAMTERYHAAGNVTAGDLALQRATASEARLHALAAEAESDTARNALATAMGLSSGAGWTVPDQLPLPVPGESDLATLLKLAQESRLDLAAARTDVAVRADRLGVVNWTRWLGDVDLGVEHERETSGTRLTGPTVGLELPVFNTHRDAMLRADAELQGAIAEVKRISIDIDNDVRLAYALLMNSRGRVQETREVLIPQRVEAVAQAQAEANFMLTDVFELIRLKQLEYDAYQAHIESIRDYWLQRSALGLAVGNSLPAGGQTFEEPIEIDSPVSPEEPAADHGGHHHPQTDEGNGGSP